MTSEKEALLNFIGGVYGQMKEIDNHIAATGSGAKFAGRSAELKNVFEQVAASTVVQQPASLHIESAPANAVVETVPQPLVATKHVAPVQMTPPQPVADQLEFSFKEDANSILKDIYNILFDIKKFLISHQSTKNEKTVKKTKKYADCCLCGSKPTFIKDRETCIMQCTGCGAREVAATEQNVKTAWNNNNKSL